MTPSRRPALHPATGLGFRRQEARGGQRHLQETKPPKDGGPWGPGRVWGLCGLTRSHSQGRQDSRAPTFKLEAGPPSPSHHGSSLLPRHWPWHQAPAPGTDPPPSRQPHAWPCPGRPQQFGTGLGEGAARCKALPPKGPEGTVWAAGEEEGHKVKRAGREPGSQEALQAWALWRMALDRSEGSGWGEMPPEGRGGIRGPSSLSGRTAGEGLWAAGHPEGPVRGGSTGLEPRKEAGSGKRAGGDQRWERSVAPG